MRLFAEKIAVALLGLFSVAQVSADDSIPQMSVYRKSGEFTHIQLRDGMAVAHKGFDTAPSVSIVLDSGQEFSRTVSSIDSLKIVSPVIPSLSFVFPDYPGAQQVWTKETYIKAVLDIDGCGKVDSVEGLELKVKSRGNTTSEFKKKPMRLKFDKKTSICGFKKSKNYVLLANYIDASHIRNAVSMWLAGKLGAKYSNSFFPCDVFVNGKYVGLFLMTEKVGINSSSVDIDEESGILFELDTNFDEPYKFMSKQYDLPVMVKDPDFDELYEDDPEGLKPVERLALWQSDFDAALLKVKEGRAFEAFDLDDLVNYILVYDITLNNELDHPKSVYVHKENMSEGSKYHFGPIWDFDLCFNITESEAGEVKEIAWDTEFDPHIFFKDMMSTPEFKEAYKVRFGYFLKEIYPEMFYFIDTYSKGLEQSAYLDSQRWNDVEDYVWVVRYPSDNYAERISKMREWIVNRVSFLQATVERME